MADVDLNKALDERAKQAQDKKDQNQESHLREYLCFLVHGSHNAIDVSEVREVISPSDIAPVPNLPPHIPGVLNLHGRVTAVLDLAVFGGAEPVQKPKRLVVIAAGDLEVAIPVSAVVGIHFVDTRTIQDALPQSGLRGNFISQQLSIDEIVFGIIETRALLERARNVHGSTGGVGAGGNG